MLQAPEPSVPASPSELPSSDTVTALPISAVPAMSGRGEATEGAGEVSTGAAGGPSTNTTAAAGIAFTDTDSR